jgi:hypothetical protein
MLPALERLEQTLTEISGPARASYTELVHGLVLRPKKSVDPALVQKILLDSEKSLDELKADVTKLANCYDLELHVAESEKGIEKCPELDRQAKEAATELEAMKTEFLTKLDAKARKVVALQSESHQLRVSLQNYQGQLTNAVRFATPRSIRDTSSAPTDWRGIDLFASDLPTRNPADWKTPVPQNHMKGQVNAEAMGARPRRNGKH